MTPAQKQNDTDTTVLERELRNHDLADLGGEL
jgi:hypothetical protein